MARQVQEWMAIKDTKRPTPRQRSIIRKGQRARERFFLCNIRLVVNCAGKFISMGGTMTFEDLIQEGLMGLHSAIAKFDPTLGYKFSTYSFWWIRQSIMRAIHQNSRIIHLPTAATDVTRKATTYMQNYRQEHGKMPPIEEVAKFCDVGPETLKHYLHHAFPVTSLDAKMPGSQDHSTYLDVIADQATVVTATDDLSKLHDILYEAMGTLPEHYQLIIKARYMNGKKFPSSFKQISAELNITRQSAQQMHERAMKKLRLSLGGLTGQECIQVLQSAA